MDRDEHAAIIPVYVETGSKRTFAGALDWPGWCRSGRDEAGALAALVDCGPRYASMLRTVGLSVAGGFKAPADASGLSVVERLPGNATTDFGAPDAVPASDFLPLAGAELERQQAILDACWQAFAASGAAAEGKELRKGPRGGGRDLEGIRAHVLNAASAYLGRLGWKFTPSGAGGPGGTSGDLLRIQAACREAIETAAHQGLPPVGPRGGARWQLRYQVRRLAWHILDHAWEIEDRIQL